MNRLKPVIPPISLNGKKKIKFEIEEDISVQKVLNRGLGAGGANTNLNGKAFEQLLSQEERLLQKGYTRNVMNTTKFGYYLSQHYSDRTVYFFQQSGLGTYLKNKCNITINRYPDESFIVEYGSGIKKLHIIEMKHQNVSGSVDIKLWAAPTLKREYQFIVGEQFQVEYALSVSEFLEKKFDTDNNYKILYHHLFKEDGIQVFFANHDSYSTEVERWIGM